MRLRYADPEHQSDQRSSEQRLGNTTICLYVSAVSDGGNPVFGGWSVPRGISNRQATLDNPLTEAEFQEWADWALNQSDRIDPVLTGRFRTVQMDD